MAGADNKKENLDSDSKEIVEVNEMSEESHKTNDHKQPPKSDISADKPFENLDAILDIPLEISVELGRTRMVINELLKLAQGSVIELSKIAGATLDILANQRLIAKGEVVVVNDKYGIRLTEVVSPSERIEKLG